MAQLGDLIVSGKARFLNKISGNIDSADKVNHTLTVTLTDGSATATYPYDGSDDVSISVSESDHYHGNINSAGIITNTDVTIASGDKLIVMDSSNNNKIAKTSISFDGSTATQCLTKKGTWATFGTSNLTIGTTSTTAMAGNTNVNNVTQTATDSTNATYELLFSGTADNTTRTEGARKTQYLNYNPSTHALSTYDSSYASMLMPNSYYTTDTATMNKIAAIGINNGSAMAQLGDSAGGLGIVTTDIVLMGTDNTWDGTNVSLKTAVTAAKGTVRQEILSNFPSGAEYPIALAYSSSTSAEDNKIYKISNLKYDPSWGNLTLSSHSGVDSKVQLGNSGRIDDSNNSWTTGELYITDTDSKTLTVESRDIYNSSKWDGTNTSLKTTLSNKLSLDGSNQMTGNLTLDGRNVFSKRSDVTIGKTANNGVTTSAYNSYQLRDSADTMYGMTQYCANSNGNVYTSIHAHNMTTGGADVDNALYVYANKDGTLTYAVTDKPNFRAAIGLADLGNIYSATKSASITTANIDSHVEGATITLGIGKYIIFGQWAFNSTTGARVTKCRLYNKTTATDMSQTRVAQGAGNYCVLQAIAFANITTNNTVIAVTGASTVTSGSAGTSIFAIKIL